MILISKADLLTQAQREQWASYFSQQGIRVAFWSAVSEEERLAKKVRHYERDSLYKNNLYTGWPNKNGTAYFP